MNIELHRSHSLGTFEQDVAALLDFYSTAHPRPRPHLWSKRHDKDNTINSHWESCPPQIEDILKNLDISCHRLSSPLDAPLSTTAYYSPRPADALFGSSGDPHSTKWLGCSFVHCPFDNDSISHTIRWALASAQTSSSQCKTALLIPATHSKAFSRFLSHPFVTRHTTLPSHSVRFGHHDHLLPIVTDLSFGKPKSDLHLYLISNQQVSATVNFTLPPRFSSTPTSSPIPLPIFDTTTTLPNYPPVTLKWLSRPAYYPDGSCQTNSLTKTIRLGAGFYCPASEKTFTIDPAGMQETNTINRAELVAIWAALFHDSTLPSPTLDLTIFTDSLCSLDLIKLVLFRPQDIEEKIHLPLLLTIRDLLLSRAKIPFSKTHFQKVKSHIGIIGNEMADKAASKAARLPPNTHDMTAASINNQHLKSLNAWPCLLSSSGSPSLASNLTFSLKQHALSQPHIADGPVSANPAKDITYKRLQALQPSILPHESNAFASTQTCSDVAYLNTIKTRVGTLWTGAYANRINRSYRTCQGSHRSRKCHLCYKLMLLGKLQPHEVLDDTAGHLLGACAHPNLASIIIKRHNVALTKIYSCIALHSPLNQFYTILDATDEHSLPHGVSSNRIAKWILPQIPDDERRKLRPDMMIFEHLPSHIASSVDPNRALLPYEIARFKQLAIVHVFELGYTSNLSLTQLRKLKQHTLLVRHLINEGWNVSVANTTFRPHAPPVTAPQPQYTPIQHTTPNCTTTPSPSISITHQPIPGPSVTVMYYQSYLRATRPDLYPPLDPHFLATATDLSPVLLPTRPQTLFDPQQNPQHPTSVRLVHPPPQTSASKRLRPLAYVSDPTISLPTRPQTLFTPQPTAQHPTSVRLVHPAPQTTSASKRLRPLAYVSDPTISDPHAALSNRVHIIFLGTEGYLYRPIDLILTSNLQIPLAPANKLLAALHRHAIYYLQTLLCHRRALDFSPSDASNPPPHNSHDPP